MASNTERLRRLDEELMLISRKLEEIPLVTTYLPDKMYCEDYFLEKAKATCKIVEKKWGTEWEAFGIAHVSDPKVVKDIVFGPMINTPTETDMTPEKCAKAVAECPPDHIMTTWIHSHAGMGVWFSKPKDVNNIEVFNNSQSKDTGTIISYVELPIYRKALMRNGRKGQEILVLDEKTGKLKISNLDLKTLKPDLLVKTDRILKRFDLLEPDIKNLRILDVKYGGWSYNIVVNNRGEHYQELAWREWTNLGIGYSTLYCPPDGKPRKIELAEPIKTGKTVDEKALEKELEKKIGKEHWWQRLGKKETLEKKEEKIKEEKLTKWLSNDAIFNVIGKIQTYRGKFEQDSIKSLEERLDLGFNFADEKTLAKVKEGLEKDNNFYRLFLDLANTNPRPSLIRSRLSEYLKTKKEPQKEKPQIELSSDQIYDVLGKIQLTWDWLLYADIDESVKERLDLGFNFADEKTLAKVKEGLEKDKNLYDLFSNLNEITADPELIKERIKKYLTAEKPSVKIETKPSSEIQKVEPEPKKVDELSYSDAEKWVGRLYGNESNYSAGHLKKIQEILGIQIINKDALARIKEYSREKYEGKQICDYLLEGDLKTVEKYFSEVLSLPVTLVDEKVLNGVIEYSKKDEQFKETVKKMNKRDGVTVPGYLRNDLTTYLEYVETEKKIDEKRSRALEEASQTKPS